MNMRRGFHRITLVLAAVAAIFCAIIGVSRVVYEHNSAQRRLRWEQEEVRKFYNRSTSAEPHTLDELIRRGEEKQGALKQLEAKYGFWVNLSKPGLAGLCLLAALGSAAAGFCVTGPVIWFGGLATYKLIRWFVLGFYDSQGQEGGEGKEFEG